MSALLLVALLAAQGDTIAFVRGGSPVPGKVPARYYGAFDTTLDSRTANASQGASLELGGGDGKTILIRFGDLSAWLPPRAVVEEATIELTTSGSGGAQGLLSASEVLAPWSEGPATTLKTQLAGGGSAPVLAATWQHRIAGPDAVSWQQAGAQGIGDAVPISEAKGVPFEGGLRVEGLAKLAQKWADSDEENFGIALKTSGGSFLSGQSPQGRPRLLLKVRAGVAAAGPDLAVELLQPKTDSGKKPRAGESVVYVARVRNVGTVAASPFQAQWSVRGRRGGTFNVPNALAPGATVDLEYPTKASVSATDPRTSTLGIRLLSADADPGNNALTIYEGAKTLHVKGDAKAILSAQADIRRLNEAIFPSSRFSFAPDGVLERVRLVDSEQADMMATAGPNLLPDVLASMGVSYRFPAKVEVVSESGVVPRRGEAWHPGWPTGEGDSRFEGSLPGMLTLPYEPWYDAVVASVIMEPTGLLSATDVAQINGGITRKLQPGEILSALPGTVILKALDRNGEPLNGAELAFFQSQNGVIADGAPAFTVLTSASGTALLPNRELGQAGNIELPSGRTMKPNPFGRIQFDGSNGVFLVRALVQGTTDYGFLKVWQLVDAFHRGSEAAAIFEMRFNVPNVPIDAAVNLAKDRPLSDSGDRLPAQMASLTDGNPASGIDLGEKAGDWVEVDLGRDRAIAEVRILLGEAKAPESFDIVAYATGQNVAQMNPWTRETASGWTLRNRAETKGGLPSLVYRGPAVRVRYVRIRNVSGGAMPIREFEVSPAK